MKIQTNVVEELEKANELLSIFNLLEEKAENLKQQIGFFTVEDVCKLTGISKPKVLELFNRPDFPVCDYGKAKIVFIPAFCDYFMKAVKTTDFMR